MNELYIEPCSGGYAIRRAGSERASAVLPTQRKAIARAREMSTRVYVARVRVQAGRDRWRRV